MVPSTSGFGFSVGALSRKVEKSSLVFGNGVASLPILPPAW